MDGLFLEIGPWRINKDQTLRMIDGSWDEYANILFVDQPIGTGFSFGETNAYPNTLNQSTDQLMIFLDKFFDIFPEYAKDEIYISGESFAGTFIPYIASAILKRNNERKTVEDRKYNLKGIAIGNGWIEPISQYNAYYSFAIEKQILSGDFKERAERKLKECQDHLKKNYSIHLEVCEEVLQEILDQSHRIENDQATCINQYDIRLRDNYPGCGLKWPYDLETITEYLRRPDVIGAIHANQQKLGWRECSGAVGTALMNDSSLPSNTLLPDILKKIPVLLFSGDQDLICNTKGTRELLANLEWNGRKGFQESMPQDWYVNDMLAGTWQTERNLSFVIIHNASHMVPYDKPTATLDMMDRFMGLNVKFGNQTPSRIEDITLSNDKNKTTLDDANDEIWDRYYNAGTATLIIVILAVLGLSIFLLRGRIFNFKEKFNQAKVAIELRNREMEELVIETPLCNSEDVDHFGDSEDDDDDDKRIVREIGQYKDEADNEENYDKNHSDQEVEHERKNARLKSSSSEEQI
ncbi:hypothetical protein G9A89_008884 [Geosiphon pyriformis]|nr:hypothetical protein G9A89_008884 [Geosiphon pyriformis]